MRACSRIGQVIESFNGSFRDECLNTHGLLSLDDARRKIESWRVDYHHSRTHSAIGDVPPAGFAAQFTFQPFAALLGPDVGRRSVWRRRFGVSATIGRM